MRWSRRRYVALAITACVALLAGSAIPVADTAAESGPRRQRMDSSSGTATPKWWRSSQGSQSSSQLSGAF